MIQTIQDVHTYLESIPAFKAEGAGAADFLLPRFSDFCSAMNHPEAEFPSIHVGGSNGKGSTCHIIASVYREAGYRVGVYTSPHLISYNERFTINGRQIPDEDLVSFFSSHQSLLKKYRLTYFEISTAIAFWWFARQQAELGIIEVGLGGRLDATNVITPLISVITNISLDHTDLLGETVEEIAREKAGIIKEGVPVVLGNVRQPARAVIEQEAGNRQSKVVSIDELEPRRKEGRYQLNIDGNQLLYESGLTAPVQACNIAAVRQVVQVLQDDFPVSARQFKAGIKKVHNTYPIAGRFEKLHPDYNWYFDGAHNLEAVQAMKRSVNAIGRVEESVLVLALMNDKINRKMMVEFSEFKKIVYHALPLGRAAAFDDVKSWLPNVRPFPPDSTSPDRSLKQFSNELVIFGGSFYFYATVRDWLSHYKGR